MAKSDDIREATSGRDKGGRFVSRSRQGAAAKRATDQLTKSLEQQVKVNAKLAAQQAPYLKAIAQTAKSHAKATKDIMRGSKQLQKQHAMTTKAVEKMNATMAKGTGIVKKLAGSIFSLKGLIAGVISVETIRRLAIYTQQLGYLHQRTRGLFGILRGELPAARTMTFFGGLAEMEPRMRLISAEAHKGFLAIKRSLRLPDAEAKNLIGRMATAVETLDDLEKLGVKASKSVAEALKWGKPFDWQSFSQGLNLATAEVDSLTSSAVTLTETWEKMKLAFQVGLGDFIERHSLTVNKIIEGLGKGMAYGIKFAWEISARFFAFVKTELAHIKGQLGDISAIFETINRGFSNLSGKGFGQQLKEGAFWSAGQFLDVLPDFVKPKYLENTDLSQAFLEATRASAKYDYDREKKRKGAGAGVLAGVPDEIDDALKSLNDFWAALEKQLGQTLDPKPDPFGKLKERFEAAQKWAEVYSLGTQKALAQIEWVKATMAVPLTVPDVLRASAAMEEEMLQMDRQRALLDEMRSKGQVKTIAYQKQLKRLELDKLNIQIRQRQLLKDIHQNYISFLGSQSFGLGAYSKLLVTRYKNAGIGMKQGMIRETEGTKRMLGQLGKSYAEPLQWQHGGLRGTRTGQASEKIAPYLIPPKRPAVENFTRPSATLTSLRQMRHTPRPTHIPATSPVGTSQEAGKNLKHAMVAFVDKVLEQKTPEASSNRANPSGQH